MTPGSLAALLSQAQPVAWLSLLLACYFNKESIEARFEPGEPISPTNTVAPHEFRGLKPLVAFQLVTSLLSMSFIKQLLIQALERATPLGLSAHIAAITLEVATWSVYLLSIAYTLVLIASLLKVSLGALPGLATLSTTLFRWSAVVVFFLALTAHIPFQHTRLGEVWLSQLKISLALCMLAFELFLLVLLLSRLRDLGLALRNRVVGLSLGLAVLGCAQFMSALEPAMPAGVLGSEQLWTRACIFCVVAAWLLYVVLPEPPRRGLFMPMSATLMRWDEIARRLEGNYKPTESTPFISGVESIVGSILKKHKIGEN